MDLLALFKCLKEIVLANQCKKSKIQAKKSLSKLIKYMVMSPNYQCQGPNHKDRHKILNEENKYDLKNCKLEKIIK